MNKIVVPVDFSAAAATALRFAAKLSRSTGMGLTVVYVFNSLVTTNLRETQDELAEDRRVLHEQLEAFTRRHVGKVSTHPPIEIRVAEGIPPVYLQWMSKEKDVAMIVMGGIGTGSGARRDFFGGIAKAISRDGGCPIVLIPQRFPEAKMDSTTNLLEDLSALNA
ncbi:nucleotide-binding universal stress UspA family protein [Lewinella marina]|nr:universal stress protein [Neolewinella marina]NJB87189.1 nucleotide-binding universal stress UspA family protein [Neolewinella marina]